jgi:hypothetical protein
MSSLKNLDVSTIYGLLLLNKTNPELYTNGFYQTSASIHYNLGCKLAFDACFDVWGQVGGCFAGADYRTFEYRSAIFNDQAEATIEAACRFATVPPVQTIHVFGGFLDNWYSQGGNMKCIAYNRDGVKIADIIEIVTNAEGHLRPVYAGVDNKFSVLVQAHQETYRGA